MTAVAALRDLCARLLVDAHASEPADASGVLYEAYATVLSELSDAAGSIDPFPFDELELVISSFQVAVATLPPAIREAHDAHHASLGMKLSTNVVARGRACLAIDVADGIGELPRRLRFLSAQRHNVESCDCRLLIEFQQNQQPRSARWRLVDAGSVPGTISWSTHLCESCGTEWYEETASDDYGSMTKWTPNVRCLG